MSGRGCRKNRVPVTMGALVVEVCLTVSQRSRSPTPEANAHNYKAAGPDEHGPAICSNRRASSVALRTAIRSSLPQLYDFLPVFFPSSPRSSASEGSTESLNKRKEDNLSDKSNGFLLGSAGTPSRLLLTLSLDCLLHPSLSSSGTPSCWPLSPNRTQRGEGH